MNILPKLRTRFGENIGVELFVSPPDLDTNYKTFLSANIAAAVSSFATDNGLKFAVSQYVVLGSLGAEKTEIAKIHASTTPTAALITLTAATGFAHNRGESVTFIPYNQIIIERSIDGGLNYSTLATINIRPDSTETYYQDLTGLSTYYYRAKFSNATSSGVSQVSDAIIATGFADNSVGNILRETLVSLGEDVDAVITKEFLYSALNEGRDDLDKAEGIERWSFRTAFDYEGGRVIPGQNTLTLPTNFREPNTFKNLLSVRIGRDNLPLGKVDKVTLNNWYRGVARTTLTTLVTSGSTSLVLDQSGDFDESGNVSVAGEALSDVIDVVAYTGNTEATDTLSGVTGIQAAGHGVGAVVWQGVSFGYPQEYTVNEGKIVFSQPFDDALAGETIWLDYYKDLTRINSDADTLDEPHYRAYVPYLRWRIKKRRNKDLVADTDEDYQSWVAKKENTVRKEYLGNDVRLNIDIP